MYVFPQPPAQARRSAQVSALRLRGLARRLGRLGDDTSFEGASWSDAFVAGDEIGTPVFGPIYEGPAPVQFGPQPSAQDTYNNLVYPNTVTAQQAYDAVANPSANPATAAIIAGAAGKISGATAAVIAAQANASSPYRGAVPPGYKVDPITGKLAPIGTLAGISTTTLMIAGGALALLAALSGGKR